MSRESLPKISFKTVTSILIRIKLKKVLGFKDHTIKPRGKHLMEGAQAQQTQEAEFNESPAARKSAMPKKGVIEAALFISNKPVQLEKLAELAGCSTEDAEGYLAELASDYDERGSSIKVVVGENAEKLNYKEASLELRNEYVAPVSQLSQNVELTKKAVKILALVAKKKKLLQSELKHYFRGDIYEYVEELAKRGYITSQKYRNTRELKPTKQFYEHFKGVE